MAYQITDLAKLAAAPFDEIIDVRSPSEFAEDHMPGAVNLPVLDDAERAEIGTIYVRQDRFLARKRGAARVARNAAAHLEGYLADRDGSYRPLVYCWRGGQRSGSFATILAQIGWRVETVDGGYQAWRRAVAERVYERAVEMPVVLLDGNTGTAKTAILARLEALGAQVIDLEGLASHRGSVFGAVGEQPSQKWFEGRIAMALAGFDPARPLILEAESSKVGARQIPPMLWQAMRKAPRLRIRAPLDARAAFLETAYADIVEDRPRLDAVLDKLVPMHGHAHVAEWRALADAGDHRGLAARLMSDHYDQRYEKQRDRLGANGEELRLDALDPASLDAAAPDILARLEALVR